MKNFFLGLFLGLLIAGSSAGAIDIAFHDASVRDIFATSALSGFIARGQFASRVEMSNLAFQYADEMMKARRK